LSLIKQSQIIGRKIVLGHDNLNELILGLFFCLTSAGFKYFFPCFSRNYGFLSTLSIWWESV